MQNGRVDRTRGIVTGVKIIGLHSKHGYDYTPEALRAAIPLYEGIKVNIDHPERSKPGAARSYADRFGKLVNVRFVEREGLIGDFHYNTQHPLADQFAWDAENSPAACGFSHNAGGQVVTRNGRQVCESIDSVRSVDLVADPATTASLFESLDGSDGGPRSQTTKGWADSLKTDSRPPSSSRGWVRGLR
jgi:hypothetical protein